MASIFPCPSWISHASRWPMQQNRSSRRDGWTPARQLAFLEALSVFGSVSAAAAAVGMSRETAYRLRKHSSATLFARAWDQALRDHEIAKLRRPRTKPPIVGLVVRAVDKRSQSVRPPNSLIPGDSFGRIVE